MSVPITTEAELRLIPLRARIVPIASTIIGSLISALPVVASAPVLPPLGLLVALGWRLLRPELWQAWIALPLGLIDDLITGQPPGSAMTLWTLAFLLLDAVDHHLLWRDYWFDWALGIMAILGCIVGGWWMTAFVAHAAPAAFHTIAPQILVSIFLFPIVVRLCAILDRWRLGR